VKRRPRLAVRAGDGKKASIGDGMLDMLQGTPSLTNAYTAELSLPSPLHTRPCPFPYFVSNLDFEEFQNCKSRPPPLPHQPEGLALGNILSCDFGVTGGPKLRRWYGEQEMLGVGGPKYDDEVRPSARQRTTASPRIIARRASAPPGRGLL
jgi:hypothetical protein